MKPRVLTMSLLAALVLTAGARAAVDEGYMARADAVFEIAPDGGAAEPQPRPMRMAQDFVPLEQILGDLRSQYSGHQLSVSGPSRSGGGYVYRIKWLTEDGAVLYVVADAETGAILSVEGG